MAHEVAQSIQLPLLKKEHIASDTFSYYFRRPASDWSFFPGQYMRVSLPINATDGRGASRFFTICSSPLEEEYIMITTKRGKSDFKNALFNLKTGTPITMFGPIGGFYLKDNEQFSHVFLAGGIGISPFHSMIVYIAKKNLPLPIVLIASFPTSQDIIFYNELTEIAKNHTHIKIIYTITRPEQSHIWKGETGRISEVLLKKYISDITKPTYYIVGPPPMVAATEQLLKTMEVPNIKIEAFTGYDLFQ